jgi:hypothetical protein
MRTALYKVAFFLSGLWLLIIGFVEMFEFLWAEDADDLGHRAEIRTEAVRTFVLFGLLPFLLLIAVMKWKKVKLFEKGEALAIGLRENEMKDDKDEPNKTTSRNT